MKPHQWQVLAGIRNAYELTDVEKLFMYNIATHKTYVERGSRALVLQRTGLTDWKFRKARKLLEQRKLILIHLRPGTTTEYTIDFQALSRLKMSTQLLVAPTKAPSRPAQSTRVGHRPTGPGGGHRQKKAPEEGTGSNQENGRRAEGMGPRTVRIRKSVIPSR